MADIEFAHPKVDQIKDDECFPCCVATVLGVPRAEVPYFAPRDHSAAEWRFKWYLWLMRRNIGIRYFTEAECAARRPSGIWIASAPGRGDMTHAVVMLDDKLYHDPDRWQRRKRRPTRIYMGTQLHPEIG